MSRVVRSVSLPQPRLEGSVSVEKAIFSRRSVRRFTGEPLSLEQLSQILWAAQGVTDARRGLRAIPSAGATYPLEVYVVIGESGCDNVEAGIYHYRSEANSLDLVRQGDCRMKLVTAALRQGFLKEAPVDIVICGVYGRTTRIYGQRGSERYVPMEVGHAAQNIHLQAEALGLATVVVGAFDDAQVQDLLGVNTSTVPLCIMPLSKKRE